jgi:hypothetical protein
MFSPASRYLAATELVVTDSRGRSVSVAIYPPKSNDQLLGYHIRRDGQTLDHLAFKYLGDGDLFWRIAEMNEVMQAEALSEAREIAIPRSPG